MAALTDLSKDGEVISGSTTDALTCYSIAFSRFIWRVISQNYLLAMSRDQRHGTDCPGRQVRQLLLHGRKGEGDPGTYTMHTASR